jgi:alginate O-acetyltransferase complex protein AlgI
LLYNSFQFLFGFLPLTLLLYFTAARFSHRLANILLVIASLVFYAWWDWHNLFVIAASILFNYTIGVSLVRRAADSVYPSPGSSLVSAGWGEGFQSKRFLFLSLGVAANLAALAYFKYANFLRANFSSLTHHPFTHLNIALPLGISFFTFTQIAFLVDAYRGQARELGFIRYSLFVLFFPHLIAGPIVHHAQLMPQFATPESKRWIPSNLHIGIAFITLGLCKKVLIADTCAPYADAVFANANNLGPLDAWRGALLYTLQIYFDFSGYCDIAIGLAMLFSIRLPDNFNSPYQAASIIDFWRRWHMTLSRFLRDYLYIPLGGNRHGEPRRQLNLFITMLLGGIWHGANWTFALWGAYHAVLLILNHAWSRGPMKIPLALSRATTFVAVVVGWVIFRAPTLRAAASYLKSLFALNGNSTDLILEPRKLIPQSIAIAILIAAVNVLPNTKQWIESRPLNTLRAVLLGILFFLCLLTMRDAHLHHAPQPFIYFNF